jgi:hypothetical protein
VREDTNELEDGLVLTCTTGVSVRDVIMSGHAPCMYASSSDGPSMLSFALNASGGDATRSFHPAFRVVAMRLAATCPDVVRPRPIWQLKMKSVASAKPASTRSTSCASASGRGACSSVCHGSERSESFKKDASYDRNTTVVDAVALADDPSEHFSRCENIIWADIRKCDHEKADHELTLRHILPDRDDRERAGPILHLIMKQDASSASSDLFEYL